MITGSQIEKEEARWYALYTKSRAEKRVCQDLMDQKFEVYLPLEKKLKQWSDRKKWIEEPMFRGYLFVKIKLHQRLDVLNTDGAVCFITFSGNMEPVTDKEIQMIRMVLEADVEFDVSNEKFEPGDIVEITGGRLQGFRGELVNVYNKRKVVIQINSIQQNILLQINPGFITKIGNAGDDIGKEFNF